MSVKSFMLLPKRISFLVLSVAVVLGCRQYTLQGNDGFVLEPGDLLFQDLDSGPLCEAIEKVTVGYQGENFSHVGIATQDERGALVVVEAVSAGVKTTPLQSFMNRSLDNDGRPKVVVGRLKTAYRHLIPSALKEALALRGRPYDKLFAADNDAYCCSELVYEAFRRANKGTPLFVLQPMTFKDPGTGRTEPAWEQYFAELGAPVPEGEPGINPGAISRSDTLTVFHPYGVPSRNTSATMVGL